MPGGLLNLVAYGNLNIILTGNPTKTFFRTTYAKYTNFGLQRLRLDYKDLNVLNLSEDSHFEFVVPNNGDLLMDTYFSIILPDIWSPIFQHTYSTTSIPVQPQPCQGYEFKWIENIGSQLIRRVRYLIDGHVIQEFTGQYLYSMVQRDFSDDKKKLFDEMTGNITELNDPANYSNRNGNYPNASYNGHYNIATDWINGVEPSIRSRKIYIPLNIWSTLSSKMAFPLTCLQYNKLHIEIDCRPIQELFVVRDLDYFLHYIDADGSFIPDSSYAYYNPPYISPDFNDVKYNMCYFLQPPQPGTNAIDICSNEMYLPGIGHYINLQGTWHMDIHLLTVYVFLSNEELRVFAGQPQSYLIKEIYEETIYNVTGAQRAIINGGGLVSSLMWFFQRSDVNLRNEWSNYSNWEYKDSSFPCIMVNDLSYNTLPLSYIMPCTASCPNTYTYNNMYITGPTHIENERDIMINWGILCDGKYRETIQPVGVADLVEKYIRTSGNGKSGLYCYNFCLNTDPFILQPSGAMNLSKFTTVELEYTTMLPYDSSAVPIPCYFDVSGNILGINNPSWKDYDHTYNLHLIQERYNILSFEAGMAKLMFSR